MNYKLVNHRSSSKIDGVKCEPIETLTIDLPENLSGKAIEMVTLRKGEMISLENKGDRMVCEFIIPLKRDYWVEKSIAH
jgi:predicted membrane GTPase involved in stress response